MHPIALHGAEAFLQPFCTRIHLHLTQLIHIRPGQGAQPPHRDRLVGAVTSPIPSSRSSTRSGRSPSSPRRTAPPDWFLGAIAGIPKEPHSRARRCRQR